jgi:S-adenosylmethionine decarboxylase
VDTTGTHLLAEYHGCDRALLDDLEALRRIMREAAQAAGATVVAEVFQPFSPQGVTGVVVIEESHFSVHTWPEYGYAAVDFYTCGDCVPERADAVLRQALAAERVEIMSVRRGIPGSGASIEVARHERGPVERP